MRRNPEALTRGWSLIGALFIFWLPLAGVLPSEPLRAVASVVCLALVIQSWLTQRKYAMSRERFVLVTIALSLPALASLWLGLNVLRFYSYASVRDAVVLGGDWPPSEHWGSCVPFRLGRCLRDGG